MKRSGIINSELSRLVTSLGHTDTIVVCDAGYPVPTEAWRVDLSVRLNFPRFTDILASILEELVVEQYVVPREMGELSPDLLLRVEEMLPNQEKTVVPFSEFRMAAGSAKGIVRTGEAGLAFANIILCAASGMERYRAAYL